MKKESYINSVEYKLIGKSKNKCRILSGIGFISRLNGTIGWKIRNIISRETNVVLKMYKTLIRPYIEYCTQAWALVNR